jgi:peptidoglycan-N-acetylmuramic acid deacetylase
MNKEFKTIVLGGLLSLILTLTIFTGVNQNEILTNANVEVSNTKIGWGIKRNDNNLQPDLGSTNKSLIDKYNGIAMGNNEEKVIYLTFDLGYEAGYTSKILDTLKEKNVQGTFFITAHYLNTASDLVERMINEGHIVGNHTVNHKSMPDLSDDEIKTELMKLNQAVYEKFGYEMKYIRPPKGEYSERTLAIMKNLGYTTVMWSFAYDDWDEAKQGREEYGKQKVLENVHNGEIMLLHGTSKDNSNILDSCIKEIKSMGYEFKNIDQFAR